MLVKEGNIMTYIRWPKVKLHISLILILVINLLTDNFLPFITIIPGCSLLITA